MMKKRVICAAVWACAFAVTTMAFAAEEAWKPTHTVTFVVPNAAAGTSDRTAREVQRIMQMHKLIDVPILISNKPGGNGTVALNQLRALPADGHALLVMNTAT